MPKYSRTRGAVAAGHSETAAAGELMLELGGNAFDAVLAAFLAAGVCEPTLTSLGGGGFMTAYTQNRKARVYDFFVQTPLAKDPHRQPQILESEIRFGTARQLQFIGKGTVATPGAVKGVFEIHKQLGKLPIREVFGPALSLARNGVIITGYQAFTFEMLEAVLTSNPEIKKIFAPGGTLLREGDTMFQPQLADTLDWLMQQGSREFYEGEIARLLVNDHEENKGSLTAADLSGYSLTERLPLTAPAGPFTLLTNPPPSPGGSLIVAGLRMLDSLNRAAHPETIQAWLDLVWAMGGMEQFRDSRLSPALNRNPQLVLSTAEIDRILGELNLWGNTTHISVIDELGNAASLTSSLGGCSGALIPKTGITLNNMLGEPDLLPDGPGSWSPGRRVGSMMSPGILLEGEVPRFVLGTGGSSRIRTAMLQVIRLLAVHGLSPEAAILFPRIHVERGVLHHEPGIEPTFFANLPLERMVSWEAPNMFFGGVHLAGLAPNGQLLAMADPRRKGDSRIVQ